MGVNDSFDQPEYADFAELDLFGGTITAEEVPDMASNTVAKANITALNPLDLSTSPLKPELDARFLEDEAAKVSYLRGHTVGLQSLALDLDYSDKLDTKGLIWINGTSIPIGDNFLASTETFCSMVTDQNQFQKLYTEAKELVISNHFWNAHNKEGETSLKLPKGSLCSCQTLGELLDAPAAGGPCDANLRIGQVKGHTSREIRPPNGCMVYCQPHFIVGRAEGGQTQRCLRIIPYMISLMQTFLEHSNGALITDDISRYRKFFNERPGLILALLVNSMYVDNWVSRKLNEPLQPHRKVSKKQKAVSSSAVPSILSYLSPSSGKGTPMKAIKAKGAKGSPCPSSGSGNTTTSKGKGKHHGKGKRDGKGKPRGKGSPRVKPLFQPHKPDDPSAPVHRDLDPSDAKKLRAYTLLNSIGKDLKLTDDQLAWYLQERKQKALDAEEANNQP